VLSLIQKLDVNQDQDTSIEIARLLGQMGDATAVPILISKIGEYPSTELHRVSIEALTAIAIQNLDAVAEVVPVLIGSLGNKGGVFYLPVIGHTAREDLINIGRQHLDAVAGPLQDFIKSGEGAEQAIKFAEIILTTLEADLR